MKKTIDEIVNNENYKAMNEALTERSIEIAETIRFKMSELQIEKIGDYKICEIKTHSGFSEEYLGMLKDNGEGYTSLERIKSCYYAGDFNCWIEAATTKMRLQFLNAAREIFDELDKIQTERIAKIESALEETNEFVKQ